MLPPWDSAGTAGGNGGLVAGASRVYRLGVAALGLGFGPWSPIPAVLRGTGFTPLSLGARHVRGRVRVRPVGDPSVP